MYFSVSKKPIPQNILDDWERHPVPATNGGESLKEDSNGNESAASELDEGSVRAGSSRTREKAKKGLYNSMDSLQHALIINEATIESKSGPAPESAQNRSGNLKRTRRVLETSDGLNYLRFSYLY